TEPRSSHERADEELPGIAADVVPEAGARLGGGDEVVQSAVELPFTFGDGRAQLVGLHGDGRVHGSIFSTVRDRVASVMSALPTARFSPASITRRHDDGSAAATTLTSPQLRTNQPAMRRIPPASASTKLRA